MSSIAFSKKDLLALIDHHIALLERFGISDEAPFSVIYFTLGKKTEKESADIFQKILRQTDALFQINDSFIVMLPGTHWNGANELLTGIQEFLDQPIQDNIVTFPEDGSNAKALLKRLQELIKLHSGDKLKLEK